MKQFKYMCTSIFALLLSIIVATAINVPLEEPLDNFSIGDSTTGLLYSSETVTVFDNETDSFLANEPLINSTISFGTYKSKSINRLLYLNESNYNETVYFIFTSRTGLNESEIDDLLNQYTLTFDFLIFKSTDGGGQTAYPPDNNELNDLEEKIAEWEEIYNNITNFTLIEGYVGIKGSGNITEIIDFLYDNTTLAIDPGPLDLLDDYPNATYVPITDLYGFYDNYTSCNDSVRTSSNDADGDLFAVCENDCNDSNVDIHPGASEVWDGIDNDCNGFIDEGVVNCVGIYPEYNGDWNITSDTTCNLTEINLSSGADVIINESVELILDNTTLYLDQDPGDDTVIWLHGILNFIDSVTDWLT